ncbi:hypothetical protein QBC35DRAFT_442830 [Podospora australis]|uniref:C2H2-type domain-containing protein n=1 Tax=Podospora australis TaxID=1536484 RepID=A0AAN6WKV9_9PEZI|nr:hypothetical protein QBC35DRAFT_442830 [Podospora australis]
MLTGEDAVPSGGGYPLLSYHDLRENWKQPAKSQLSVASTRTSGTSFSSRSPSPSVTPSESSNCCYAASTTSSWATSAGPATECGFPGEDEAEKWSNKWDDPRMPPNRAATPADRFNHSLRPMAGRSGARSPSRPSSLRNTVSARDDDLRNEPVDTCPEEQEAESYSDEESGCDDDESDVGYDTDGADSDDNDNEWSGENGNLESLVISAVDMDYSLAAFLIPRLYRDYNVALKSKVENWRSTAAATDGGSSSPSEEKHQASSANTSPTQGSPGQHSRKRRRTNSDDGLSREKKGNWDDDEEEDGEDEGRGGGKMGPPSTPLGSVREPLLACLFHKRDPIKYNAHGEMGVGKRPKYRSCSGPGFKSIQRLKEHLKRNHSPVQCERCKMTFTPTKGGDRAECLNKLNDHRKSKEGCPLNDASLKEGVDDVQWAMLDRQSRRKNQELHRVEKWFEIWDVLFPDVPRPESPWHEIPTSFGGAPRDGEDYFVNLFFNILDHKIQQGDIPLPTGSADQNNTAGANNNLDLLRDRLKTVVQNTFRMYVSMRENFSSPSSSSQSQNRQHSLGHSSGNTHRSGTVSLQRTTVSTAPTSVTSQAQPQTQNAYAAPPPPPPPQLSTHNPFGMPIMSPQTTPSPHAHGQFVMGPPTTFTGIQEDTTAHPQFYFHSGNHNHMFTPQPGYWLPAGNVNVPFPAAHPHLSAGAGMSAAAPEPTWFNFGDASAAGAFGGHGEGEQ